ncbi:MAG: hypothetical protein U0931_41095 [Vulcanimicrobiota bacterium]
MPWLCLLFLFSLCAPVWSQTELEVRLGPHSVEVEGGSRLSGKLPDGAKIIPGDHLHYRIGLCPVFPVQVLTPQRWLPSGVAPYKLHIQCQPGVGYVTSLPATDTDRVVIDQDQLDEHPLFAFGRLEVRQHRFQGGVISAAYVPGAFKLTDDQLNSWIQKTGQGVAGFFGRFPVERAVLLVTPLDSDSIEGVTYGQGGPHIWVQIPKKFSAADEAGSWQLCHEMVHLAVPDMPYEQHWLEEGIATYVEPLIRLQTGEISAERVWLDLLDGLPKGLADVKKGGLDGNHRWGATYWGGALYCLLADLRLRVESQNQHHLQEALRAVVARGNITQNWTISEFLDTADQATQSQVFHQVHQELGRGGSVDLDQLWRDLGIEQRSGRIHFVAAPLDFVRRGMTGSP